MSAAPFRAAVVGGSVGGLAAAIELRDRCGADVVVHERSAGEMQARGAGVVMQPEVEALLRRIGTEARAVCVELHERVSLERDGRASRFPAPQLMSAWDTLYRRLRVHLGDACYRQDSRLVAVDGRPEAVTATFADGHRLRADLLVGADGVNSSTRALMDTAGEAATHAGYVAWRGLEDETNLPGHLVDALAERFTSCSSPGMQMLCYLVPGADGATAPGRRRVNWVWYVNTPEAQLESLMTGKSGVRYRSFLPAGEVTEPVRESVRDLAGDVLPSLFRDLVDASALFMQPVQDVEPGRRVRGRVVLLGDAAGTVRPHTAAGTSKAFGDAAALAGALRRWVADEPFPESSLARWAEGRAMDLEATAWRGRRLAAASGLGVPGVEARGDFRA